ncbi:hypothetical protein ACS0TY_029179 [Phlomoides rotata]
MNILSWNCRGLGQSPTIPTLKELIKVHRPVAAFRFVVSVVVEVYVYILERGFFVFYQQLFRKSH